MTTSLKSWHLPLLTTLVGILNDFHVQMVMLYQDPEGESVGNFTPSLEASAPNFSMNQSNTDHVERVNLLEKTLQEKEKTISELQHQVKALKVQVQRIEL